MTTTNPTTVPDATDHDFLPVAGVPDDDECTHRSDGTDATYCGRQESEHATTDPSTAQPATPGEPPPFDLDEIDDSLDEVRANVDHGEAQYNPWALQALRAAERLRAELDDARRTDGAAVGLHWAADRLRVQPTAEQRESQETVIYLAAQNATADRLDRWADELDAAPAAPRTYALPAEPPAEVTELWEVRTGRRWEREDFPGYVRWRSEDNDGEWKGWLFRQFYELLPRGPLSTAPAGTEAQ